jgi:uncharacterized protein
MIRDPTLHLAKDLRLPVEAVTQTFAILAKRGAGKTYTAAVMVEELPNTGLQVVVVDPIGVWWGLRSSADGQHEGLPIVIMGGEHGDLPLEVGTGELIADVVVEEGPSVVLDLTRDRRLRARCQAILMAARGRRHRHTAADVGISGRTIQRWLKA